MIRKFLLLTLALLLAPACAWAAPKPNIIFIMADDLGYGDLGSYGQKVIQTPHLDQMAREGLRFTQVYTGSPVCAPSRSVLMTGQHTGHTRVRGNTAKIGGVPPQKRVPLEPGDITVAELLKTGGYITGITGKWGLGEPGTDGIPTRQGFDEWFGYLNQQHAHNYFPEYLWKNEEKFALHGNENGHETQYSHDLFTDWALDFIQRHHQKERPFFLYLAYCIPHDKFQIPEPEPYAAAANWPRQAQVYASMVTRMDRDIGRLFNQLNRLGIDQNTIVFFCSDNGAAHRYDGLFDSSGPLRGRKRDVYEGGIRTPMIVRWPRHVPAGATSDAVWYFPDVLPTLAALAEIKPPTEIDGMNLLPTLLGRDQKAELNNRFLYWEFHEGGFQQAARRGDWKAVRKEPGIPLELYQLARDHAEEKDVAAGQPELVAAFEAYLKSARTPSPNWPVPIDPPIR